MQRSEPVGGLQALDQRQHFQEIEIESDNETIKLSRVNLGEAMGRVQEVINQKTASSFYKNITVHLGTKSRQRVNYLVEHYEHRLQVMKLALEEEKELLRKIIEAKDERQLQMIQKEHELNKEYIKRKQNYVRHQDFIPCIYIQAEKKRPLFGLITQEFSRHGMGNFVAKLGYRSPFLNYDKLEFNFQWPISSLRRKYYQIGAEWTNPISEASTASIRLNSVREPTYKNIDSEIVSVGWGILKGANRYEIQYGQRNPFAHSNIEQNINSEFYRSSSKFALKYSHFFENSIRFEEVAAGKYSELKSQLALPVLGDAKFLKVQYNFRKFFDTYKARDWFNNEFIRKFFWKSTVESNFSISAIAEYGRNHFLNDILESIEVRGFQAYRKPMPSYLNLKGSFKFNIHNYPLLKEAGIVSFLYTQMGVAFLKSQPLRPYVLSSCGLGLSFYAGPFTQIELLCNLMQWQSKPLREPANFQIRFGVFD